MQRTAMDLNSGVLRSGMATLLLCFMTVGCPICISLFSSSADIASASAERTTWSSRAWYAGEYSGKQYVRIVEQDRPKGGMIQQNDHPIMLEPGLIRSALSELEVKLIPSDKPIPIFTGPELDVLGKRLSEGLALAGPYQDVTFVVYGLRSALFGIAKRPMVTTGRVFYKDGKLNIIFGRVVGEIKEHIDPRLQPLAPGSRSRQVSHEWTLPDEPGMQLYSAEDMMRSDWVMLDLASIAEHEALGTKSAKTGKIGSEPSAISPERVTTPQETRQAQPPAYQAPAIAQVPQTGKSSKTIEERLLILNDLKNKKLITDEEYKAKRAAILNDL